MPVWDFRFSIFDCGASQLATVWSQRLVAITVDLGIMMMVIGMLLCLQRLYRGPHLADRAIALDTIAIHLIGLVILLTIRMKTVMFFEGVLVLSLLGFAGTIAVAQYIARPHLDGKKRKLPDQPDD